MGDIIYHRYDPEMQSHFTQALEQTQYSAGLAVKGAWRGASRQRLYKELGWESLYDRRWYRRLCQFFVLKKQRSPQYLAAEIPNERQLRYNLRNPRVYDQNIGRTNRFANTYFQNSFMEWNKLDNEVKQSVSIAHCERRRSEITKVIQPSICDVHAYVYCIVLLFLIIYYRWLV